jgi:transcriptional regulator with XRE-family HTH domain
LRIYDVVKRKPPFAEEISRLRRLSGYTQTKAASNIGITRDYLKEIERGKCRPNFRLLTKFAAAYRVKPSYLFEFWKES